MCYNVNNVFLIIIVKVNGAVEFKYFRFISMVGVLYKIIFELLSRRLKVVMNNLVGES